MSNERAQEFVEEDFGGGEEEVREEEEEKEYGEGEEIEQVGEEEVGADEEIRAENGVREGEGIGAENEVREREEFVEEEGSFPVENIGETTSASSPNKRIKEMPIDRLSALPDILLFRILSFLDTKEAAITAVLSKRWRFLWLYLPWLKFCESSSETEKIRRFVAWVSRTLVICNGKDLLEFEVEFTYDRCFASDINVWVEFAVKNKVNGVSLLLNSSSCKELYRLPQMMFYNSSLRRLWMRRCIMAPRRTIEWPSLTKLYLEDMEVPQRVLEEILSGCPDLCNLLLRACWGFNCLEVSQKLDALGIGDRDDGKSEPLLEISAPYTESMLITQYPKGRQWRLTNIPLVDSAHIDFTGSDWDASSVEVMSNMKYLFENLQHVKELELGCRCVEILSVFVGNGWQLPQSRRECLTVNASSDEHNISGIVDLLESSPNLETLVINGYRPSGGSVTLGRAARRDLDCELVHLRTVHITISPDPNLTGEPMLTLAEILLRRAPVLEKMVIDVEFTSDFVNVIQTLLGYPRSSQKAMIILR